MACNPVSSCRCLQELDCQFVRQSLTKVSVALFHLLSRSNENRNEAYLYQLFTEKDDRETLPTVQTLLEQSMLGSDVKLEEVSFDD